MFAPLKARSQGRRSSDGTGAEVRRGDADQGRTEGVARAAHASRTSAGGLGSQAHGGGPQWNLASLPVFSGVRGEAEKIESPGDLWGQAGTGLSVAGRDDPREHEAERIAERVRRMPASGASIGGSVPARASGEMTGVVPEVLGSAGQALDARTRAFFEPRFGHDLGHVRIHDGAAASASAEAVKARAYTVGSDIAFRRGEYQPETKAGRHLLAHELAHTMQPTATPVLFRQPVDGWNYTPSDFKKLQGSGKQLTIAADSNFFPAKLQDNLLKTLAYVLGPAISPPATEGINRLDFFHGHLVIKRDPATDAAADAEVKKADAFQNKLNAAREKALGKRVTYGHKYRMNDKDVPANKKVTEDALPEFGMLLDGASKVPGAALMYHTFEFNQPSDLKAKGLKKDNEDPRRQYVTPLDTNQPRQYAPPPKATYEKEYFSVTSFTFLVDDKGAVHVRTFSASGTGLTTLDLSTITGTALKEPELEK